MAIPKIIHYCWFGKGEKNSLIKRCIRTWYKTLYPEYEIIEWNENNFNVEGYDYTREMYRKKKWAFVSDYVRLHVLHQYGGIYLDTDVEVLKKFDNLLNNKMFLGFMFDCNIGTAIIGSEKNHPVLKDLLNVYQNLDITNQTFPNNDIFTKYLLENYPEFKLNNRFQVLGKGTKKEITIYPKEYFELPSIFKKGYTIHNHLGSWYKNNSNILKRFIKNFYITKALYGKIVNKLAIRKSPFREIYLKHSKEVP